MVEWTLMMADIFIFRCFLLFWLCCMCVCWCSYDQEIDGVDRISPPVQCEVSRHVGPGFGWFWTKYWLVMVVLKHIAADCFGADHEAETFRR